jgi:AcrR family transcriptional regulator
MPPKVKYTKEKVVKTAIEIIEEEGMKELTVRNIAKKLGSSTAPVYRHFETMDELALEVIRLIQLKMLEYTSKPYTDRVFLNMGTGVAMFACEHSNLYRALLLEGDNYRDVINEFLEILETEMTNDLRFKSLSQEERHVLLNKMWTFTHGLASLISVGLIKDCNQEFIIKTLMDVGSDVIGSTLAKHESNKSQLNKG